MSKTITIQLDYPVQLADKMLTEITIRRITAGDIVDHPIKDNSDFYGEMKLLGAITNMNLEDLRLLDLADYEKLQTQVSSFRSNKQKTVNADDNSTE